MTGFLTTNKKMIAGMFSKSNHLPASMKILAETLNMMVVVVVAVVVVGVVVFVVVVLSHSISPLEYLLLLYLNL